MGYSTTHGRSCALTIPAAWFASALTDFPVLFTTANLPTAANEMFDADGTYPAKSDGSDIRFSTDSAGNTPCNVQIVTFSIDNNPALGTAEIWVKVPSCSNSAATVVYVWYNDPDATLPAANDADEGSQGVWDSSFMGVWHLQESASNDADHYIDSTVNALHGTGTSMALTPVAGPWGSGGVGQDFDGSADYINTKELTPPSAMTLSAWIYKDDVAVDVPFAMIKYVNPTRYYSMQMVKNNSPEEIIFRVGTNDSNYIGRQGNTALSSAWRNIAGTWSGGTTSAAIDTYMSGSADDDTDSNAGTFTAINTDSKPLTMGCQLYSGSVNAAFNGKIDEVRLSNAARSSAWLTAEYNTGNAPGDVTVGTPSSPAGGSILPIILQVAA